MNNKPLIISGVCLLIVLVFCSPTLAAVDETGNPAVKGTVDEGGVQPKTFGLLGYYDAVLAHFFGVYASSVDKAEGIGIYTIGTAVGLRAESFDIVKGDKRPDLRADLALYDDTLKSYVAVYGYSMGDRPATGVYGEGADYGVQGSGAIGVRGIGSTYGIRSDGNAYITGTLQVDNDVTVKAGETLKTTNLVGHTGNPMTISVPAGQDLIIILQN